MFAANDSETEIYYASESPPDLESDLEENNAHDEDLEAANDAVEDLTNRRNHSDFNTTNMDLDGEYTSEDEEQRQHISPAPGHAFQRLIDPYNTRHHRRSSSQRIRGFSPLNSRLLRRTNAITPSFLTQHIKNNNELGLKNINGAGSKELGQFRLPESSFLRAGMTFSGTQNLMNTQQPSQRDEEWEVKVTVHYVNYKTGTAIGLMEALNVPNSSNTVVTYWEGEMIDFVNHSLWTDKWNSTPDIDLQHWKKFDAFRQMDVRRGTPTKEWFQEAWQKYIFMRWKEHYFVNVTAQESGLTIAGFYYICIRRSDGTIEGYYFDPVSTPYQKLTLKPLLKGNVTSQLHCEWSAELRRCRICYTIEIQIPFFQDGRCSYADSKHEVLGYLGGTCDVDRLDNNTIVCHVSQFVASERVVTSLLTDTVQEVDQAREDAINTFKKMGLEFIGWYRSNLDSNSNTIPTQYDIIKQQTIQSQYPDSAGIIVSMSTISCPPINIRGLISERSINALCVFRTVETNTSNNTNFPLSQTVKSKNRILKGKGKEDSKANKVIFTVNRQMYMCSNVMQQLNHALMTVLREIKQTYSGQVLDCDNRIGQRIFVDSQHESFLMNFLKKSVLQFDRSIDQDFRSLAVAKHHVKTLIMKRVNGALATCQSHSVNNGNDVHLKRKKLEKLIEKLVTQRMARKEIGGKKSENVDDVVRWTNPKSSDNDRQNNSEGVDGDTKITQDPSLEVCENSPSIITPVKQSLKKACTDSSRNTPNPKKIKFSTPSTISFGGNLAQAASFPESKPFTGSGSTSIMSGSSTFNSNQKNTSSIMQFSSSTQQTVTSSPTFTPITSSSSTHNISISTNNPAQAQSNRLQYPPINTYQYSANCYRPFHNTSEDLSTNIHQSVPCNDNKPLNGPPGTCVNLPSIQGLLEITIVVNPNIPGVVHTPFSIPYQNNFYSFGSPQLPQTGTHSIVAPMPQHLHQMNSSTPQSSTQRHYIPIAPSPTTTAGNRPPLPSSSPAATIYTTTSHRSYPANYHEW
ncbi:2734_t:CDS:10 [Scutellospora calospora]|uniref:2734_t:CDS:1 n=1 Tax=Scutellospora calospora TaxID=85575 RepID=A0ACA9JUA2_9GLOM|nr:2734_t:CDS:10 [Scutellospora calospora]